MGILLAVWTVEALPVAATAPVAANTEVADCSRRDTGEQLSGTVVNLGSLFCRPRPTRTWKFL